MEKDVNYELQHENLRKKLWIDVYVAYVGSSNAVNNDGAASWADISLKKFDERFKLPQEQKQT